MGELCRVELGRTRQRLAMARRCWGVWLCCDDGWLKACDGITGVWGGYVRTRGADNGGGIVEAMKGAGGIGECGCGWFVGGSGAGRVARGVGKDGEWEVQLVSA